MIDKEYSVQNIARNRYGLLDISLTMKDGLEMPYYSVPFADKKFDVINNKEKVIEYNSYWKSDRNKPWEDTLAKQMIGDPNIIITKNTGMSMDGHYITRYGLTYYDKNSPFFKPSIQYGFDSNNGNLITLEFLFVFENNYVFPVYKTFESGKYFDSVFKMIADSLKDFNRSTRKNEDEFFMTYPGFDFNKDCNELNFYVSSETMGNTTFTFSNDKEGWDAIKKALVSIRVVENKTQKNVDKIKYK